MRPVPVFQDRCCKLRDALNRRSPVGLNASAVTGSESCAARGGGFQRGGVGGGSSSGRQLQAAAASRHRRPHSGAATPRRLECSAKQARRRDRFSEGQHISWAHFWATCQRDGGE